MFNVIPSIRELRTGIGTNITEVLVLEPDNHRMYCTTVGTMRRMTSFDYYISAARSETPVSISVVY